MCLGYCFIMVVLAFLRRWFAPRRISPWLVLLASRMTFAHDDHTRHPQHDPAYTLYLDLEQAIALAAKHGPQGTSARAPRQTASQLSDVARPFVTQLPYVQTQLGPRRSRGTTSPEFIVEVSQPFTWGDTSGVQKRVARAALRSVDATTRSAELQDAERAATAWVELALADHLLTLRKEFSEQSRKLLELAKARVAAGEAQPLEVALAESDLADANSAILTAEALHFAAELDLAHAIGQPGSHIDVNGTLEPPADADANGDGDDAVHPAVLAAESRATLATEQIEYAKLQQAPTLALGVQYQREGTGDQVLTAVATLPLPVAKPWAFQQTQQRLAADTARAEAKYVRSLQDKSKANARHELAHSRAQYEQLEQHALPPLREAYRIAMLRYTHGETDFTNVSLIRQRLIQTEERLIEALADVHLARVRWLTTTDRLLRSNPRMPAP